MNDHDAAFIAYQRWYDRRVQQDDERARAEGFPNVLRRHIARLDRLLHVRARLFLMGAEADNLWA